MRTVNVELVFPGDSNIAPKMHFSTEVILDNETDATGAGQDAAEYLMSFSTGFTHWLAQQNED